MLRVDRKRHFQMLDGLGESTLEVIVNTVEIMHIRVGRVGLQSLAKQSFGFGELTAVEKVVNSSFRFI